MKTPLPPLPPLPIRRAIAPAVLAALVAAAAAHAGEPLSPHALALERHRDAPTHPALLARNDEAIVPLSPAGLRGGLPRPCRTVFGYLPYWEGAENLRYDLLSHVGCFSVEVNANGSLGNDHGWPWVGVINDAHAAGARVVLVATLFNGSAIDTLISTPAHRQAFFVNIRDKLLEGSADGLNIDFESGTTWQDEINDFMADLTAYLHAEIPGCEVTFAGPAVNWSNRWDLGGLAASCDGIFIMGYAFAGSWSSNSGANAPLTGGSINITNTVLVQYADALATHPERLILGVPYYGHHWTTSGPAAGASAVSFIGSTRFYNDQPDSQMRGRLWHAASQTPWYRWQQGGTWHQVWYDDAESLGLKYDLAISQGLQGVGMWALNYDGARPELWDLLEDRFGGCAGPEPGCCDMDDDGDVDADDLAVYLFCLGGPDATYGAGHVCARGDVDGDADVDVRDFAAFQAGW